jgi:hypothetical protein
MLRSPKCCVFKVNLKNMADDSTAGPAFHVPARGARRLTRSRAVFLQTPEVSTYEWS